MSYQNTGYARNKILTVTKGDYSQSYNICDAFAAPGGKAYSQLSNSEFAKLSSAEYEQRRTDFIAYVYSMEDGLQSDCPNLVNGSVVYDPVSCPITNPNDSN